MSPRKHSDRVWDDLDWRKVWREQNKWWNAGECWMARDGLPSFRSQQAHLRKTIESQLPKVINWKTVWRHFSRWQRGLEFPHSDADRDNWHTQQIFLKKIIHRHLQGKGS